MGSAWRSWSKKAPADKYPIYRYEEEVVMRFEVVNENGRGQYLGTHVEYRVPGGAWARTPRVPPCEDRDRG